MTVRSAVTRCEKVMRTWSTGTRTVLPAAGELAVTRICAATATGKAQVAITATNVRTSWDFLILALFNVVYAGWIRILHHFRTFLPRRSCPEPGHPPPR